jgi:isopenicillin-N N-acyltransferase-like protein
MGDIMKKSMVVSVLAWLIVGLMTNTSSAQKSNLSMKGNLRVLVLEGTPYERGFKHGKMLKNDIDGLMALWKADIEKTYKMNAEMFISRFVEGTDFLSAIKEHTPALLEEVRGIADGAGIAFETMFAFQLVDEMWVLGWEFAQNGCTSFGVMKSKKDPTITAQTLDIPLFYHGYQTLLHVKDPKKKMETYVLSFPGFIGANGMNDRPVSVCVNAIQQLQPASDGLPVAFVVRGILEQESFEDAVQFVHKVKHAAGQNYVIGGVKKMASYECSEKKATEFLPFEGALFTYHTNHPLTNDNYSKRFLDYLKSRNQSVETYRFVCTRFAFLQERFRDNSELPDVERLKSVFQNRDSGINNRSTFSCTIMVLQKKPELYITAGRPDEAPFEVFRF